MSIRSDIERWEREQEEAERVVTNCKNLIEEAKRKLADKRKQRQ